MSNEAYIEDLVEDGYAHLDDYDFESAIDIGETLEREGQAVGFEIQGIALARQGELQSAVNTLERGVKTMPTVWELWQLLGNLYCDQGHHDKALNAFEAARGLPDVSVASLEFNKVITLERAGRMPEADAVFDALWATGETSWRYTGLRLRILERRVSQLCEADRPGEAVRTFEQTAFPDDLEAADMEMASVLAAYAIALNQLERRPDAVEACRTAIAWSREPDEVFHAWRAVHGQTEEARRTMYEVQLEGPWPEGWPTGDGAEGDDGDDMFLPLERGQDGAMQGRDGKPHRAQGAQGSALSSVDGDDERFYVLIAYLVAADSEDEAVALAKAIEPATLRGVLMAEEINPDETGVMAKGVYRASPHMLFPASEYGARRSGEGSRVSTGNNTASDAERTLRALRSPSRRVH
ncbi:MAG: tetratricopeptide repeat protein [Pseudomonadota bacterium]